MAEWILKVYEEAYTDISLNGKVVEGRVPDPSNPDKNYGLILPQDEIIFQAIHRDGTPIKGLEEMIFPVTYNHHYATVGEMLESEGLENLVPGCKSIEEGIEVYLGFPGYEERVKKYGIYAIGLGDQVYYPPPII